MWSYFFCSKSAHRDNYLHTPDQLPHRGSMIFECHDVSVDIDPDYIVMVARFHMPTDEDAFASEPGVKAFPHIMSHDPIGPELAAECVRFGAKDVVATDTTWKAAMKLRKISPALDPRNKLF